MLCRCWCWCWCQLGFDPLDLQQGLELCGESSSSLGQARANPAPPPGAGGVCPKDRVKGADTLPRLSARG